MQVPAVSWKPSASEYDLLMDSMLSKAWHSNEFTTNVLEILLQCLGFVAVTAITMWAFKVRLEIAQQEREHILEMAEDYEEAQELEELVKRRGVQNNENCTQLRKSMKQR